LSQKGGEAMNQFCTRMMMLWLIVTTTVTYAQFDPKKVCRVEEGKVIFILDKRWNESQRKQVAQMFNLDSIVMASAFSLKPAVSFGGQVWKTRAVGSNLIELTTETGIPSGTENQGDKIFLLEDRMVKTESPGDRESVTYGVNKFTRNSVVQLSGSRLRFFLPGYKTAKHIFISGSFNAWSTLQTPMQPCDSGWTITLKLQPGKYTYKYIVDGKWVNDPNNKLREKDTYHGYNNIFFAYNYKFVLKGYQDSRNVFVAGSFNGWNDSELRMIHFNGSWVLPLYLREGTHSYKFLVDGNWMTDPANKVVRPDGSGNQNSFLGIGDTLFFTLKGYPNAKKVNVCGDFNAWNAEELTMNKTRGGWQLPYVLASGNYEYKFVVDGEWITDPTNPYTVGVGNSVNSYLTVKPNYYFRLEQYSDADHVIVTGSFNGWSRQDYRMDLRQGTWWFPICLKPGKYTYKFIVDNKWITDPGNELWEDNEYGTGNSVLWIDP